MSCKSNLGVWIKCYHTSIYTRILLEIHKYQSSIGGTIPFSIENAISIEYSMYNHGLACRKNRLID